MWLFCVRSDERGGAGSRSTSQSTQDTSTNFCRTAQGLSQLGPPVADWLVISASGALMIWMLLRTTRGIMAGGARLADWSAAGTAAQV